MTYEARSGFSGLTTNVAETKAQPSALRVADNVVVRQPGSVEPRQGFEPYETEYSLAATDLTQGEAHGPDMVFETNGNWRAKDGTPRTIVHDPKLPIVDSDVQKLRSDSFSTALARGNMYLPHLYGVAAAPNADAVEWRPAGLAGIISTHSLSPYASGIVAGRGLEQDFSWSYRFVLVAKDENGLVRRSQPSGAQRVDNNLGIGAVYISMQINFYGSTYWEGFPDEVEVYRGRAFPIAIQPDDEMQLVATIKCGTGRSTIPASYIDSCPDVERGAALYTNPSREGFEGKNDQPPACSVVEPYRGHLFFGDCVGPQRTVFSHAMSDRTGEATGVGWRDVTAAYTNGSPNIVVSDATGLQKGMIVYAYGSSIVGHIVSISGTTITIHQNNTFTDAANDTVIVDAAQVDGRWFPLVSHSPAGDPAGGTTTVFEAWLHDQDSGDGTIDGWSGKFTGVRITPPESGQAVTHIVEQTIRNGSSFPMRATHGDEMQPPLPLYDETGLQSESDSYPNMLMWSKQDEPEHVPPTNYVLIGDKTKRLLALCHTRDAIFVFKEDGVWRLTGYAGQWSIDPFDMTLFCLLPSSVRRLNNRIYLLSNQGVVIVSDDGVEPISFPIADQTRKLVDDVRSNFAVDGYYHLTGINGVAASADDRNSEYILLLGEVSLELNGAQALVYNDISRAWTTFSFTTTGLNGFDPQALALAPDNTPLILHYGGVKKSSYVVETTLDQPTRRMYDGAETAVTVSVATAGGVVTISAPHTLVAGRDVLIDHSGISFDIESVTSTTVFTVRIATDMDPPALGTGSVRRGFLCTVQPHGFLGTPQLGKHWNNLEAGFSRLLGPVRMTAQFSSAQPLLRESDQVVDQDFEFYRVDGIAAFHLGTLALIKTIPVDHARAWLLRTRITWLAARGIVSLELMQLDARTLASTKPQQSSSGVA